jgi:hypothetical protein
MSEASAPAAGQTAELGQWFTIFAGSEIDQSMATMLIHVPERILALPADQQTEQLHEMALVQLGLLGDEYSFEMMVPGKIKAAVTRKSLVDFARRQRGRAGLAAVAAG